MNEIIEDSSGESHVSRKHPVGLRAELPQRVLGGPEGVLEVPGDSRGSKGLLGFKGIIGVGLTQKNVINFHSRFFVYFGILNKLYNK